MIDTHSHIYSEEFNGEVNDVVMRAFDAGVEKILLPNIDSSSIKMMMDISARFPGFLFPMMGIHPTSVKEDYEEELEVMNYWLRKEKFFGIGEIGIDFYWDNTFREEQETVFRTQLQLAKEYNLPVSIHTRDSFDAAFRILEEESRNGSLSGVFHCFTGTVEQAQMILDKGFKIGVGGIVTFKNAGIDKMIAQLSPQDILIETDSPYLAPTPMRGKRNESSYLGFIVKKLAEIFNSSEEEIAKITSRTAQEIFRI
ncbi:MAG: TatD family hydrolase [Prolixibacteraceae bacterium]|jgi:TatD DNase family protein|nr:TatD family hydrolase [Prolixibacteraceae bacterium]